MWKYQQAAQDESKDGISLENPHDDIRRVSSSIVLWFSDDDVLDPAQKMRRCADREKAPPMSVSNPTVGGRQQTNRGRRQSLMTQNHK